MSCPQPQYREDCLRLYAETGNMLAVCPCYEDCLGPEGWNGEDALATATHASCSDCDAIKTQLATLQIEYDRLARAVAAFVDEVEGHGRPD